jgi:hypothetical protein
MASVASVVKWSQRHRAVGSPAALKMGGHRPYLPCGARRERWKARQATIYPRCLVFIDETWAKTN